MSTSTGWKTTEAVNKAQNSPDFEILIDDLPPIFKKGLYSKTLDPPNPEPTLPRTVTVKCLHKSCG